MSYESEPYVLKILILEGLKSEVPRVDVSQIRESQVRVEVSQVGMEVRRVGCMSSWPYLKVGGS